MKIDLKDNKKLQIMLLMIKMQMKKNGENYFLYINLLAKCLKIKCKEK